MDRILRYRIALAAVLLVVIAAGATALLFGWRPYALPANAREILPLSPAAFAEGTAAPGASSAEQIATATPGVIEVYVTGAVIKPGVYSLDAAARVQDAVQAAGGPTANAALEQINMAARLHDEEQITVPHIGDPTPLPTISAPAPDTSAANSAPNSLPTQPIDINKADATTLQQLPSIGPVLAQRIVDYRQANGPFSKPEDLMNVSGIGPKLFDKIKAFIVVGAP